MGNFNYEEATLKSIETENSKILKDIYSTVPDSGLRFLYLTEKIPNWETYITEKQLNAAERYIKCLNACEVDYQLNLNVGTTQQRLFGSATSKGALGKLEEVAKRLEKQGYFEKQKMLAQKAMIHQKPKKPVLSEKLKTDVKELFRLVIENPDYEKHLTPSQCERIYQFLRLRSIKGCARHFNVTETTFKQSLLGRGGTGGILGKLKTISNQQTVSSWDDL